MYVHTGGGFASFPIDCEIFINLYFPFIRLETFNMNWIFRFTLAFWFFPLAYCLNSVFCLFLRWPFN